MRRMREMPEKFMFIHQEPELVNVCFWYRRGGGGEAVEGEGRRDGMWRIRREIDWKRRMNPGGRNEKEGEGREH